MHGFKEGAIRVIKQLNKCATQKTIKLLACAVITSSTLLAACSQEPSNASLSAQARMQIDTSNISVSGLSSGGYMAAQFHLSHADIVKGAGIIAAGPYNCARGSIATVFAECIDKAPTAYPADLISPFTANINKQNLIAESKVWLLHGTLDQRIHANVAQGLFDQYKQWLSPENLSFINNMPFSHVFPTEGLGGKCDVSESPYIGDCGYDAAGKMLNHLLGPLKGKLSEKETNEKGQLLTFKQADLADLSDTGMAENGFIYFPTSCNEGNACKLHVSFHGCNQSISNVDDAYAKNTGINQWAASNNLIILYPQVTKSTMMPMNPQACWDWWGYTDANYANKDGKQIQAIRTMIDSLSNYLSTRIAPNKP